MLTLRRAGGLVEDAALALLLVFLAPIAIIVVGAPIALCVRLVVEIARRW
jgi:hypothetical protein